MLNGDEERPGSNCRYREEEKLYLHNVFRTPYYLYLALDYCSGRVLSFHLAREVIFPENEAFFYLAELILTIEHL